MEIKMKRRLVVVILFLIIICVFYYIKRINQNVSNGQYDQNVPHISQAAVKEQDVICYRDGKSLMCKKGTNTPFILIKNMKGEFLLHNEYVYYFVMISNDNDYDKELHRIDINSKKDIVIAHHTYHWSFIDAYENSVYIESDEDYHSEDGRYITGSIYEITENGSKKLYEASKIYDSAIIKGQLFLIAENESDTLSYSYVGNHQQEIEQIDLKTADKQPKKIADCQLPWNVSKKFLSDGNVIYYLNVTRWWTAGDAKEIEIIRMDSTGARQSIIKREEAITLCFILGETVVYYCPKENVYEKLGEEILSLGNRGNSNTIQFGNEAYYWYEQYYDESPDVFYRYDGQNFSMLDYDIYIKDFCVIDQTLYYCFAYDHESDSDDFGKRIFCKM